MYLSSLHAHHTSRIELCYLVVAEKNSVLILAFLVVPNLDVVLIVLATSLVCRSCRVRGN